MPPIGKPHHSTNSSPNSKPVNLRATLINLWKYLKKESWLIIFITFLDIIATIIAINCPRILGDMTNLVYDGITQNNGVNLTKISQIAFTLIIFYLLISTLRYLQDFILAGFVTRFTQKLRHDIYQQINHLPIKFFDKFTHGETMSYFTNDVETLTSNLAQSLSELVAGLITLIGTFFIMLNINLYLTLIAIIIVPLTLISMFFIVQKSQKIFLKLQNHLADINGQIEETYGGHIITKLFNAEKLTNQNFSATNHELYQTTWQSQFISTLMMPLVRFFSNIGYVAVCVIGGWLTIKGQMTVGGIQAFIQYIRQFNQPIMSLSDIVSTFQSALAAAERIFNFLETPAEIETGSLPLNSSQIKGDVLFKNVKFGYSPDKIIIHNFNSHIKPGQNVALVGPTGAGKTTIVKLLMRFYDLNEGQILLDGTDITQYSRGELRSQFGMVLQDTWLFSGTIADNIRYARPSASDEEVIAAAKNAEADHFIRTLPKGYNFHLNEEATNISAGQKQLLTIARAFLAQPKLLILDEATSSVDTRTEINIQKAMQKLTAHRTSFIIAHRLSTIREADLILVINHGDIVEQGTHQQLIAKNGFYTQLYQSQFEINT